MTPLRYKVKVRGRGEKKTLYLAGFQFLADAMFYAKIKSENDPYKRRDCTFSVYDRKHVYCQYRIGLLIPR